MADRDLTVYRSFRPEVIQHCRGAQDAIATWGEQMKAFLDESGMGKRTVWTDDLTGSIVGLDHDGESVPDGWRVDRRTGYLKPRLATKTGKAIAAKLVGLRKPDPSVGLPGMPGECFVGLALATCGLRLMKGALYATWSTPIPVDRVDLTIWQPVKLSEYYAVVELEEAERG